MAPTQGDKVEFVGVFAGGDDHSSGEQTPVGFQDTPGQWYSAIQRKRGFTAAVDDGEATLRDSQETQPQSNAAADAATEPVTQAEEGDKPPVFVYAAGSLGDENGRDGRFRHQQQEEDEIDEDETQIIMSLSQDHYGECVCVVL